MAFTKQLNATQTARVDNASRQIRFFFSDAAAQPPNALHAGFSFIVDRSDGVVEQMNIEAAIASIAALDAPVAGATGRAQLIAILQILNDAGLAALGFTST